MSCGVGCRCGSDPTLLWLWHRLVATALIRPLAWQPPCAAGAAQEMAKSQKKKKKKRQTSHPSLGPLTLGPPCRAWGKVVKPGLFQQGYLKKNIYIYICVYIYTHIYILQEFLLWFSGFSSIFTAPRSQVPSLAQPSRLKDLVLLQLQHRSQRWLRSDSWARNASCHGVAEKEEKMMRVNHRLLSRSFGEIQLTHSTV